MSCTEGEKILRRCVLNASKRNIPAGYRHNFVPNLPNDAIPIRDERDALRASNPGNPRIATLERDLRKVCDAATREKFDGELAQSDCQTNNPKFVDLVRRM